MDRRLHASLSLALLGLAVGACASDAGPGYQSGVDGNLQLGQLTPDQQVTICKTQAAYVHAHVDTTSLTRFLCAFSPAVLTSPNVAACDAAMTECVNAFSVKVDVTATDPNAPPPQCAVTTVSQCAGTVGAYEACVNSLVNVQLQVGTDFSCGQRASSPSSPTVGVDACGALGPTCTAAAQPAVIR